MANVATLFSRGRAVDRAERVNAGSGCVMAVLLQEGCEADNTLIDRRSMADVLNVAANKEANWLGGTPYVRKAWTAVTILEQPASDRIDLDLASDPTWLAPATWQSPQRIVKVGFCYATSTNAATSAIFPLMWADWQVTAEGNDLIYQLDQAGFYRT